MKINWSEIKTKSNMLSTFRVFLAIPIFFLILNFNDAYSYRVYAVLLMVLGVITDLLDGYLARKYNEITEFGKIIDPLADKVNIVTIIILLYYMNELPGYYFWIIVLRDVIIFTGGIIVSNIVGKVLPSNLLGKITVLSIGFFIIATVLDLRSTTWLYESLKYLSLILSVASVVGYAIRGIELVKWKNNEVV
jgi:CDP-diacylglycerol--glycerol-3-phosphate 3-phosphatidyltransferase